MVNPVRGRGAEAVVAGAAAVGDGATTVNGVLAERPLVPATTIVCRPGVASAGIRTVTEKVPAAVALKVASTTGVLLKVAVSGSLALNPEPESTTGWPGGPWLGAAWTEGAPGADPATVVVVVLAASAATATVVVVVLVPGTTVVDEVVGAVVVDAGGVVVVGNVWTLVLVTGGRVVLVVVGAVMTDVEVVGATVVDVVVEVGARVVVVLVGGVVLLVDDVVGPTVELVVEVGRVDEVDVVVPPGRVVVVLVVVEPDVTTTDSPGSLHGLDTTLLPASPP